MLFSWRTDPACWCGTADAKAAAVRGARPRSARTAGVEISCTLGSGTRSRTALLIHLENVVRDGHVWATPEAVTRTLTDGIALAGTCQFQIALAPASVLRRYAGPLASLRLPCEAVVAGPDAADHALLAHASHLAGVGYGAFVVMSGDHIFSAISTRYPTTVIVRRGQPVARALRQTAHAVLAA